jgi:hypothetical protein
VSVRLAAFAFCGLVAMVCAFQLALALGAPWGEYAMGGAFPGKLPPPVRAAAVLQAVLLAPLASIMLARAGVAPPGPVPIVRVASWITTGISGLSVVMNLVTPSTGERLLWAPVALGIFALSLRINLAR